MKQSLFAVVLLALCGGVGVHAQEVEIFSFGSGHLGVEIRDVTEEDLAKRGLSREFGALVTAVQQDSPAARAGIVEGDVIVEFAGVAVISVRHLQRLVSDTPVGREVDLTLMRGDDRLTITAAIEQRPGLRSFRVPGAGDELLEILPDLGERFRGFRFEGGPGRHFFDQFFISQGPRLGVGVQELTDQMSEFLGAPVGEGILVMEVEEGSPAAAAGLSAGDVILSIDSANIHATADLRRQLKPGIHELEIVRNGQRQTVDVELAEKESSRGGRTRRM